LHCIYYAHDYVFVDRHQGVSATVPRGALEDIRVLDLSLLFPGPYCAQMLGDLGADVISVEPPAGDYTRGMPSEGHPMVNRNKRGVALDLKDEVARAACLRIAAGVDVVIEGFRPGVVDRLGVGYEQVREVNPAVVYCSISGFGQNGPLRLRPGHDMTYLGASGCLSFSGHWSEPPRRQGVPMGDASASAYAAIAILAALHERDRTGSGAHLDVAITDTSMAFATLRGGPRLDLRPEDQLHLYPNNDLYAAADGRQLSIAAIEEHFWENARRALGAFEPRLLDARFDDDAGRRAHGDELKRLLDDVIARKPAAEWMQLLAAHDVPAQEVLTLAEAVETPQVAARGLIREIGGQRHVRFPVLRDGEPMGDVVRVAPRLGEHTRDVLEEFGVDPGQAAALAGSLEVAR
jgi:crotonobetainyl-CoA:carnitine CoA-transferase CaiB-like acyl-CoA transferase